jgi:hypothetical protein
MALKDHKMTPGEPFWGTKRYNPALDEIQSQLDGKADLNHSHGESGSVAASIGTADARPTGTEGLIHSELEGGKAKRTVILNGNGQPAYHLVPLDMAIYVGLVMGGRA